MLDASLLLLTLVAQASTDAPSAAASKFEQRGFLENRTEVYPQTASNDSSHVVDEMLLRYEASYKFTRWLRLSAAVDARTDTHRQVSREAEFETLDREILRPSLSMRRLGLSIQKGKFTVELGRQFIRWGKADILNPTDRFAPKDYLSSVVDTDFLGVTAARVTYENGNDSIDVVWQPFFTPSRTPLLNQRWTSIPPEAGGVAIFDGGARYPGGSQYGARWNHIGAGYEYSLSYFQGFQNLPSFTATGTIVPPSVTLTREYPNLRLYGADAAMPLHWFTMKGEAAYFTTTTPGAQEYALYVLQVERLVKEWSFVAGYAGSATTRSASELQFAADRGVANSFVGRVGLTIDTNRSVALETTASTGGAFVRAEYSQLMGQHWRATGGFAVLRGDQNDFLGEYRRNSYGTLSLRYSF